MEFKIEIYQTNNGKRPFSEWMKDIKDFATKAKLRLRIDRLEMGNFGQCEPVGEGVFELKIDFGPGFRIYYVRIGLKCVLLLLEAIKVLKRVTFKRQKSILKIINPERVNYE